RIDAQDATKNVNQHRLHALVAEQDFERVRDLFGISPAANIEEVRGHAAGVFDDIHRRHCEPGAVDHAAHTAIELDVVQAVFRSLNLERIFFRDVAQFADIGMAEERIVIESQLGIECEKATVCGGDEGIYFEERCICVKKGFVEIR